MASSERLRQCWAILSRPLSTVQATVGFCAALISLGGVILPFVGIRPALAGYGEVVTVVHDVRSRKPIPDATVEILTPQDALVTTLSSEGQGRARRSLKEGHYRVRVSHPRFMAETRQIQVQAGQTAEVRIALGPRRLSTPSPSAAKAPEGVVNSVKKFFRDLER